MTNTPTNVKLKINYTWGNTYLTGTVEQIERVLTLAIAAARANVNCEDPALRVANQQELGELRVLQMELYKP